jgi:hypothetical protein
MDWKAVGGEYGRCLWNVERYISNNNGKGLTVFGGNNPPWNFL